VSRSVLTKVCGITDPQDALLAAACGARAIGMVFWPGSPRCVDVATARRIARALPPFVLRVGVFVDAEPDLMAHTAQQVGLDLLQLHGDEPPELCDRLPRRALKAVRVNGALEPERVQRYAERAAGLLFDSGGGALPGGTGRSFDWRLLEPLRARVPFLVLAGGLTPENVRGAIAALDPDAVDVSSGVESAPGRKDPAKLRAFLAAVSGAAS
jgi:phosphoribosylanthranilate isomerase